MTPTPKPRVFFVDDEKDLAVSLAIKYENIYATEAFTSPHEALNRADESVAVVVADQRMPRMTGLELLAKLRVKYPDTGRILLTAFADLIPEDWINGAQVQIVPKIPSFPDDIRGFLADAVDLYNLHQEMKRRKPQLKTGGGQEKSFEDILGNDPRILEAIRLGKRAAAHDRPVLITGESGTGKDVLARAIHFASKRKGGPFKVTNCAYLQPELAQAALFGRVKGAYTDANETDLGILRNANGGTLLLNEIGDLRPGVQAYLLTFLDRSDIEPVGYSGPNLKADVRIIAATSQDIASEAHASNGAFRLELFHRLSAEQIHLPPLRERRDDIPTLVNRALEAESAGLGLDSIRVTEEAIAYLQSLPYPGNVRELIYIVDRALGEMEGAEMEDATTLALKHVQSAAPPCQPQTAPEPRSLRTKRDAVTKQSIEAALNSNRTQTDAAAELDISTRHLRNLINSFGIATGK